MYNLDKNVYLIKEWVVIFFVIVFLSSGNTGCKKLAEAPVPTSSINTDNVFEADATAIAAVTTIYSFLSSGQYPLTAGTGSIANSFSYLAGLSADELMLYSSITNVSAKAYYKNKLESSTPTVSYGGEFWNGIYQYIYKCNAAIAGLQKATMLNMQVKKQLQGEVKFMRGFFYFYLTNLYGDVPLALGTDYKENASLSRIAKDKVYQQIITDLTEARSLLSSTYLDGTLLNPTSERVRPTKWTAAALLARVYLYTHDWTNADIQATAVISNSGSFNLPPLSDVFIKNSTESIWQLQPVSTGRNTNDAFLFIIPASGFSENRNPAYMSNNLLSAFELTDQRKSKWTSIRIISGVSYSFAYKYKSATLNAAVTEYLMVLRLAEQYLIRAEARIQGDKISDGIDDLNILRNRASNQTLPLGDPGRLPLLSTSLSKSAALEAVLHERQVELFTEWGHRWLDLKRTGTVDAIMTAVSSSKNTVWQSYQQLYPIPIREILANPKLGHNNPGY